MQEVRWPRFLSLAAVLLVSLPAQAANPPFDGPNHAGEDHSYHDHAGEGLTGIDLSDATLVATDFLGALLYGADFSRAHLRFARLDAVDTCDPDADPCDAASFSGADLSWASLREGRFPGADFSSGAILFGADLTRADLSGADFTTTTAANLRQANLTAAIVDTADLRNVDLTSARADYCVVDAEATNGETCVSFAGAKLEGATLDYAEFTRPVLKSATLDADTSLFAVRMRGANLAGVTFASVDLSQADFAGATLSESKSEAEDTTFVASFEDAVLTDATLAVDGLVAPCTTPLEGEIKECVSFAGAALTGVRMQRVDFTEIPLFDVDDAFDPVDVWDLTGVDFSDSDFYDDDANGDGTPGDEHTSQLRAAKLDQANLQNADLTKVDLIGATLIGADLSGATLTEADLSAANLTGADLGGATLTSADLSGANLTSADLGGATLTTAELRAATLSDADLSGASLAGASLIYALFSATEFAKDATGAQGSCVLAPDGAAVDLLGADLADADFSTALHFSSGCITVDQTTTYTSETKFPDGFTLKDSMLLVPEPSAALLQLGAVLVLVSLRRRQRLRVLPTAQTPR